MNPKLIDPNNHAPEVRQDDEWSDAEGMTAAHGMATAVLPSKRSKESHSADGKADFSDQEGIRIDVAQMPLRDRDSAHRVELVEIHDEVVRLEAESGIVSKITRQVSFLKKPAEPDPERKERGEGKEWGVSRKQSVKWLWQVGAAITVIVVVGLLLLPQINRTNAARQQSRPNLVVDQPSKGKDIAFMNEMYARQAEAERLFLKYAGAGVPADLLGFVRDSKAVEPLIRANFHPLNLPEDWKIRFQPNWRVMVSENRRYGVLSGFLPDYSAFSAYFVLDDGHLYLDWKATTGFGTATFEELSANRGDPTEIRGMIVANNFYTQELSEKEYQCYRLISPNQQMTLWVYTRRNEPVHQKIGIMFAKGLILNSSTRAKVATVRLRRGPDGTLPNQWIVDDILEKGWVLFQSK